MRLLAQIHLVNSSLVTNIPTQGTFDKAIFDNFGNAEYRAERLGARPIHLKLRLPNGLKADKMIVSGGPTLSEVNGEWIVLHEVPREADIIVQVVAR